MLFTFAEYFLQINFISIDALLRNSDKSSYQNSYDNLYETR